MKCIVDWFNGGQWQWKYYCPAIGRWFDYGPPFTTRERAERWIADRQ